MGMLRRLFIELAVPIIALIVIAEIITYPERVPFIITGIIILLYLLLFLFLRKQRAEYKIFIYSYLPVLLLVNIVPKVLFAFKRINETSILYKASWTFDVILFILLAIIASQKLKGKSILQLIFFVIVFSIAIIFLISIWIDNAGIIDKYAIVIAAFMAYLVYGYFTD
jgi:hypothetical protein